MEVVNAANVAVVETPVVAPVKAPRNPNVSDELIITTWETIAARKNAEGKQDGSAQEVADKLGMKLTSLNQRKQSLKSIGIELTKFPRQASTGSGGKKKDPQAVLDILNRVRAQLAETQSA